MNAYEYAMRMELEAEKLYRDMADKTSDGKLKSVLVMLADEELKHYKAFEKMSKNQTIEAAKGFDVKQSARKIFVALKAENKRYSFNDEQVAFYKKAADVEDKSYQFYMQKAAEESDEALKTAWTLIAEEEKKHQELLENIANFVASPNLWLESAEFYRIIEED